MLRFAISLPVIDSANQQRHNTYYQLMMISLMGSMLLLNQQTRHDDTSLYANDIPLFNFLCSRETDPLEFSLQPLLLPYSINKEQIAVDSCYVI